MSSSKPKLVAIENGVDLLLDKIKSLTTLAQNQEERIDLLTNELSEISNETTSLKSENIALIAKNQSQLSQKSSPVIDQQTYNQKINELVNEINNCISLLNK